MKNVAGVVAMVFALSLMAQAEVVFQNGFESYDAGTVSPAPEWVGGTNQVGWVTLEVFEDAAKAHSGTKGYAFHRQNSLDAGVSGLLQTAAPLRPEGAGAGVFTASSSIMLGNADDIGSGQIAFKFGPMARDAAGKFGAYMMFISDRWNRNRRVVYYNGATSVTEYVNWPTDEYMNVELTMDETAQTWGFSVAKADGTVLSEYSDLSFKAGFDGTVSTIGFYMEDNGRNDGFYNRVDDLTIDFASAVTRIPGDANGDGMVDVGDLGILAGNYGTLTEATWAMGDFNEDGAVDVGDLGILAGNYGTGTAQPASVPEPVTLGLLIPGCIALLRRRS